MARWRKWAMCAWLGALVGIGAMQATTARAVEPGEYLYTEGGHAHGSLVVKKDSFAIETVGGNCHTCSISGALKGSTGTAVDGSDTCRLSITGGKGALKVDSGDSDACRAYCGARAMFDGQYRQASPACTDRTRAKRLAQARALYAKKDYAGAAAGFSSLIGECSTEMDWIEADSVRSDLALTQYHLGDNAQCLATLAQTAALRNGGDDAQPDTDFGLPPCDADNYRSTGKAILHNAALCKAPRAK